MSEQSLVAVLRSLKEEAASGTEAEDQLSAFRDGTYRLEFVFDSSSRTFSSQHDPERTYENGQTITGQLADENLRFSLLALPSENEWADSLKRDDSFAMTVRILGFDGLFQRPIFGQVAGSSEMPEEPEEIPDDSHERKQSLEPKTSIPTKPSLSLHSDDSPPPPPQPEPSSPPPDQAKPVPTPKKKTRATIKINPRKVRGGVRPSSAQPRPSSAPANDPFGKKYGASPSPETSNRPWGMEEKQFCLFMHLSQFASIFIPTAGIILPLVMWLTAKGDSPMADAHGRIILNWNISSFIYAILSVALLFVFVGIFTFIALAIVWFLFPIIGCIKASQGETWKYPLSIPFFSVPRS